MAPAPARDAIEFDLFRAARFAVADGMALTVHRSIAPAVPPDRRDGSAACRDAPGWLVAQRPTVRGRPGSLPAPAARPDRLDTTVIDLQKEPSA